MSIRLITIGALSVLVSFGADSQNQTPVAASPVAPSTLPAPPSGTIPRALPSGQGLPPGLQEREQLRSTVPNRTQPGAQNVPNSTANSNGGGGIAQDQAVTAADRTLLAQIQQNVQANFRAASPWAPVHFNINNGVVTLMGTVPNQAAEEQLEALIQQVPGVTGVVDQLAVRSANSQQVATGADQSLLLRVRQSVLPQIQVAGTPVPINFNVQQGVVTIVGTVPNVAQAQQIAALVQQVPGVVQVNNQMTIGPSVAPGAVIPNLPTAGSAASAPSAGIAAGQSSPGVMNNNLAPTGRTNAGSLPPVMENQNELPAAANPTNAVPRMR